MLAISNKDFFLNEPLKLLNASSIQKEIKKGSVTILTVIDSTNQYFLDRLYSLHSGDVCIAEYQYSGRGRYGRKWFSPFGLNLYLSMYWNFQQGFSKIIGLNLVISIVITEILYELGVHQVQIKWPNDIYFSNRKLAGILIESKSKKGNGIQIVIGIGINLLKRSQVHKNNQNWISLQEIGVTVDRNKFAVQLIKKLQISLKCFEKDGMHPFFLRWEKFK